MDTRLHEAADKGDIDTLRALLEEGVDINTKNEAGYTALYHAVHMNKLDATRFLIEHGASTDVYDHNDRSMLDFTVSINHIDPSITKLLIDAGMDVNRATPISMITPLHSVTKGPTQTGLDKAKLLIDAGADVNAENYQGHTPLYYATNPGMMDIANLLKVHGARYK